MRKILIGYDGSSAADAAIDDLIHAFVPAPVEALVLSVADVWLPASEVTDDARSARRQPADLYTRAHAVLEQSRATARQGTKRLSLIFPTWSITAHATADSPGWALVQKARSWKADLIVVGAHSHSLLERLFFGSTASKVVAEANCSVRISRPRPLRQHLEQRIIVAVDGSDDSEAAVREVASRSWSLLTQFRIVTVLDPKLEGSLARTEGLAWPWMQEHVEGTKEQIAAMTLHWAEQLRANGRLAEPHIFEGDPKKVLLHEAHAWEADAIFLGARGSHHGGRWLLGSVASAVSSRAHCSVEIARSGT